MALKCKNAAKRTSCFEALTAIAHIGRSLSALVAPLGDEPGPTRDGLVEVIREVIRNYLSGHSGVGNPIVLLLVFGFEGTQPWIAKLGWQNATELPHEVGWITEDTLSTVGQDALFEQRAGEWRDEIQAHEAQVSRKRRPKSSDPFDKDLELARHDEAQRKTTEEKMLSEIESKLATGIGGVLQRLGLGVDGDRVVASFTQDDSTLIGEVSLSAS